MYEQFFGLQDEPFRLTPDPRYLFLSTKHAEALAHLRLGLTESSGFVCITGDVGTGKTTLLRTFLSELGPNVAAAYALVPPVSAIELLHRICREFGVPTSNRSQGELVEQLHAHLIAEHDAHRLCVVVLDEAQALSIDLLEQIRLLLNLETETQKLLRIVLVGQPQLRKLLLNPALAQLNQRITLRWHLGPLSYRETVAYVSHRLSVASNGRAASLFTQPALRLLHSVSGGVPRLINMVAHRALLAAFIARETRVNRRVLAHAYREIQAVPLPGTLSPARKAAWAAAGLAIGASIVSFAAPRVDRFFNPPLPSPMAAPTVQAAPAADGDTAPVLVSSALAGQGRAAERPVVSAAPTMAAAAPVEPTPPPSATELAQRLASLGSDTTARMAMDAIFAAWKERALASNEIAVPENVVSVALRRGLDDLSLNGNLSMLRILDLPALLVVHVPGVKEPRYIALTQIEAVRVVVSIGGVPTTIDDDLLSHLWSGEAHVFWRDFERFSPLLRHGERGVAVLRLQELLRRVHALGGEPTGVFDDVTLSAVLGFQRAHLLDTDGLVGPLTEIVLYAAAGGYGQPTLTNGAQGAS